MAEADSLASVPLHSISRAEAKAAGLQRYFTGKPCVCGHVAERRVSNWNCCVCEYIKGNCPEVRNRIKNWKRATRKANPEKARSAARSYIGANKEKSHKWAKRWRDANPEYGVIMGRRRRAKKVGNGGSHTQSDLDRIFKHQGGRCAYARHQFHWCYTKRLTRKHRHVDHIIPLSCGGTDNPENIQFLCSMCNVRKYNHSQEDFLRKQGLLL